MAFCFLGVSVQRATEGEVPAPELILLNSYGEVLETLYEVQQKGGVSAVWNAWSTLVQNDSRLLNLHRRAGLNRQIMHASELTNIPPVEWLVEGMIPARSLCVLYGAPGAGKSFFALDLAARLAVTQPVLYVATEGCSGYQARLSAWEKTNSMSAGYLYFGIEAVNLLDDTDVAGLILNARERQVKLIILDTFSRCLVGADENGAKDMGLAIAACDRIRQQTHAALLLVHHTGKSGSGERGSSALRGACDSMIELTNQDGLIRVRSSKLKDGKPFDSYTLCLIDCEGSMALVSAQSVAASTTMPTMTENQRRILEMLALDIFQGCGAQYRRITEHTGIQGSALDRALSTLKRAGYIEQSKKGEPYRITSAGINAIAANPNAHLSPTAVTSPDADGSNTPSA